MIAASTLIENKRKAERPWHVLAQRARWRRRAKDSSLYTFLIAVSVPIIIPYFWLITLAFSAKSGLIDTKVLWSSISILVPGVLAVWVWSLLARTRRQAISGWAIIGAVVFGTYAIIVGPSLNLENFRFMIDPNFNRAASAAEVGQPHLGLQFPSVWVAARNSLFIAGWQTLIVTVVSSLSAYYISRFQFPGRNKLLPSIIMLHAFPTNTLIIPLFLLLYWMGLLDTLTGVMLVLVGIELPFAIFVMKGFFDAVPWEIEMSALTDGASRRQAFLRIVLPHVKNGLIAIAVFSFIRGWEEYVFMLTFLVKDSNWTMSLYMFFVAEEDTTIGINYGLVSALGVFYVVPSLIMYTFAQKYIMQVSIGGVRG